MGHIAQANLLAKQLAHQMVRAAQTCRAPAHARLLLLGPLHKLRQIADRHIVVDHQQHGKAHQHAHGLEVFFGVVIQLAKQKRIGRQRGEVGREHEVAVVMRTGAVLRRNIGAGTGLVVDDNRALQIAAHGLGNHAPHHVGATACGVANHPLQRLFLGYGSGACSPCQTCTGHGGQKLFALHHPCLLDWRPLE